MPGDRLPIENNPGFYTRNGVVEFRFRDKKGKRRWRRARTLAEAKRLRAKAAEDGLRYPVLVEGENFHVGPSSCAWWEEVKRQR